MARKLLAKTEKNKDFKKYYEAGKEETQTEISGKTLYTCKVKKKKKVPNEK